MAIRLLIFLFFSLPLIANDTRKPSWYYLPSQTSCETLTKCRPRLSNKLNIGHLFVATRTPMQATQMTLCNNLLHVLYAGQPIFHRDPANPINKSGLENLFASALAIAQKWYPEYKIRRASTLYNIDLGERHAAYFYVLSGGCAEILNGAPCRPPSLVSYLGVKT